MPFRKLALHLSSGIPHVAPQTYLGRLNCGRNLYLLLSCFYMTMIRFTFGILLICFLIDANESR